MSDISKSNGSASVDLLINSNQQLQTAVRECYLGNCNQQLVFDALLLKSPEHIYSDQYTGTQWWFKSLRPRSSKNTTVQVESHRDKYTLQSIRDVFARLEYTINDCTKDYCLNIIGVRSNESPVNIFNDTLILTYVYRGKWVFKTWPITTDCDLAQQSIKLCPGQYVDAFELREHNGKYAAMCQRPATDVAVCRKGSDQCDPFIVTADQDVGINIIKANKTHKMYQLEPVSGGCQIFQESGDFSEFIEVCQKAAKAHGNLFSYTLLTDKDFL